MSSSQGIKILLADSSRFFVDTVALLLSRENVEVVGRAYSESDLFNELTLSRAEILVYDQYFLNGRFELTVQKIRAIAPDIKILVLGFDHDSELVDVFISKGADGYCNKTATMSQLADLIAKVNNGEAFAQLRGTA